MTYAPRSVRAALTNGNTPRGLLPASPRTYGLTQQALDALDDPANLPIMLHDEFMLQVANGEPKALEIKAAVDRWQALRDSAYRAYSVRAGVPVAPARFHDLCGRLATLYADPDANRAKITEILHILGI